MKAASVMKRIERIAAYAAAWGQITAEEHMLLLEDVGDIAQVYRVAAPQLAAGWEARIVRERVAGESDAAS